ncbi:YceI family protein [Dyadobacter sp. CY345]|uniref:YceI family protein n=1 Tax=Dyadobacter sp. CY345 TaxID=2909335 RepID=UPI001F344709|nr:YceI family protein [Dyadobacter sp. CY345]MCF2446996.1 YceI family protein [Dyadobacter sp. CY345]
METNNFRVDSAKSSIDWTGKKVTGAHNGTIDIESGTLILSDGKLSGGDFTIDVSTIKILDVTDTDLNAQFAGHLFSEDFFSIEQYPHASFAITSVTYLENDNYKIVGNLTIKGITHPASFHAEVAISDQTVTAFGKIIVDRTKYDMKFRSGNFFTNLGDTLIYNEFELEVKLQASVTF